MQDKKTFLGKLQQEAQFQSKLHTQKFLPTQFEGVASFIGRYPWQFLVSISGLTAFCIEVLGFIQL